MLHRRVRYLCTYEVCMSSALKGSSALQCFECGNMIEIHTQDCHKFCSEANLKQLNQAA